MTDTITPFIIRVSDEIIDDLKRRLRTTRWPEAEPVDDWSQGVPLAWIQEVCHYWAEDYDWRAREAALNRFDHFTVSAPPRGAAHRLLPRTRRRALLKCHHRLH